MCAASVNCGSSVVKAVPNKLQYPGNDGIFSWPYPHARPEAFGSVDHADSAERIFDPFCAFFATMPRVKKQPLQCPFKAYFEDAFRQFLATEINAFGDMALYYSVWAAAGDTPLPEYEHWVKKAVLPAPYILPASHWLWGVSKSKRRVKPMKKLPTHVLIEMMPSQTRSFRKGREFWTEKDGSMPSFDAFARDLLEKRAVAVVEPLEVAAPTSGVDALITALVAELIDIVVQQTAIPLPGPDAVSIVEEVRDVIQLDEYLEDEPIEDVAPENEPIEEVLADVQPEDVPFDEEVMEEPEIGAAQQVVNAPPVEVLLAPAAELVQMPLPQRARQANPAPRTAKPTTRKAKSTPKKAKQAPKKAPAKRHRRRAPIQPSRPAMRQRARGDGFVAKLMADNTIRISGTIPNVDWKASTLFKAAHDGEVILRPPPRSRFTKVAAGISHIMMLTDKDQVMIVGSNKFGQLGTSLSRAKLTRAAAQTPATILRPLYGMSGKKVQRIEARGHESSAWVNGVRYCCGVASDHSWRSSVMEPVDDLKKRMRQMRQGQ
uniref:PMD domain-containing protein n=1 Tax=Panagrellus redivivus TaxID=6233 RepID=A0A7E4ULX6_PANRE